MINKFNIYFIISILSFLENYDEIVKNNPIID